MPDTFIIIANDPDQLNLEIYFPFISCSYCWNNTLVKKKNEFIYTSPTLFKIMHIKYIIVFSHGNIILYKNIGTH